MPSLLADEPQKAYITEVASFGEKLFPQFSPFFFLKYSKRVTCSISVFGFTMLASGYHPTQRERHKELSHITKAVAGLYSVGGK